MITLLDTMGPAIWRASWQAAVLAVPIFLLLRCLGERLAPRWRFWIWGIVIARLLFVATPASPWSVFNLASWNQNRESKVPPISQPVADPQSDSIEFHTDNRTVLSENDMEPPKAPDLASGPSIVQERAPAKMPGMTSATPKASAPPADPAFDGILIVRILTAVWFTGCLILSFRLLAKATILRRRLSACRPVMDASLLELLETSCRRIGLKRPPALLVTPECISPCTAGLWRPKIVLPESVVTGSSIERLNHVFGARTGPSCAPRFVDELASFGRKDLALVQSNGLVDGSRNASRTGSGLRRLGLRFPRRTGSFRLCRDNC